MDGLIDTTEMYLRTLYELEEEGVRPLRARIAERLDQSGPTVSQTVARMERDGLLTVEGDRHVELTPKGHAMAVRVMRKHRIAERWLSDVLELPWEDVHAEACRWEHVMSDEVERRMLDKMGRPTVSPYGNPIPGLNELGARGESEGHDDHLVGADTVVDDAVVRVTVRRIAEPVQDQPHIMAALRRAGVVPGASVKISRTASGVQMGSAGEYAELPLEEASHVFVDFGD